MTEQEKQLVLVDLCARWPYGVAVHVDTNATPMRIADIDFDKGVIIVKPFDSTFIGVGCVDFEDIIPYLRPMSSMTEEEKDELRLEHEKDERLFLECINKSKQGDGSMRGKVITHYAADWCNKHHFDYRGLIEKGLALEAPEGMYKF